MFGLKEDWSLDVAPHYYSLEDYTGNEARWCPGCGGHSVLGVVQRICRDEQIPPEKTISVSGIGCSSRFPHYMATYGFHGLHGRALPVACGIKSRRPDLHVWVSSGDGDCFSIGAGHWVHAIRYNMDMTLMVFDNAIYGLTKSQTSPTTFQGTKTNTHPEGAPLPSINPLTVTLGVSNVSFVAQTVDWKVPHLYATLKAAHAHKGFSFVRILQRCPQFSEHTYEDYRKDASRLKLLTHENGIQLEDSISGHFPVQEEHDPSNMVDALSLANELDPIPIGLLYSNPQAPRYSDLSPKGLDMPVDKKIQALNNALDRFGV